MKLKVVLPSEVFLDQPALKVVAEAADGSFCLLPRHIDFVTALVPGILSYLAPGGEEHFLAVDEGILTKCGEEVRVATWNAVRGLPLGELARAIDKQFRNLGEQQRKARAALGRLEASLVRQTVAWEHRHA